MYGHEVVYTHMESLVGRIVLARVEAGITHILFQRHTSPAKHCDGWRHDAGTFRDAIDQLRAYFDGERVAFDLPLAPAGTPFQKKVWNALRNIPYGETRSYGELAARIGFPAAARAVGAANGRNPIAIVVPCHRVIGANGTLTGYAGGLNVKKALLEHERSRATQDAAVARRTNQGLSSRQRVTTARPTSPDHEPADVEEGHAARDPRQHSDERGPSRVSALGYRIG